MIQKEIVDDYVDNKLSSYTIAKKAGCSHTTVIKILKQYGIVLRKAGRKPIINERQLIISYYNLEELKKRVTVKALADVLKVSPITVAKAIKKSGWMTELMRKYE